MVLPLVVEIDLSHHRIAAADIDRSDCIGRIDEARDIDGEPDRRGVGSDVSRFGAKADTSERTIGIGSRTGRRHVRDIGPGREIRAIASSPARPRLRCGESKYEKGRDRKRPHARHLPGTICHKVKETT